MAASDRHGSAKAFLGDCNIEVDKIIKEIQEIDAIRSVKDKWSTSLNLAFLDPEGLEIHWETV